MKNIIVLALLAFFPLSAFSFTECDLTPNKVFLNLSGNTVWICFDGARCINKTQNETVTEAHINRLYSTGMAAISAGKQLRVRYPQDGESCSDLTSTTKSDIHGLWFLK